MAFPKCPVCNNSLVVKLDVKPRVKLSVKSSVKLSVDPTVNLLGGTVGGDSPSAVALSGSESDVGKPNNHVIVSPDRARAKGGRPSTVEYTEEFDAFWANCDGKKGNKAPAFNSFVKLKPPVELTVQRWAEWMKTDQWRRGMSQHMVTWLNQRGWENEPHPDDYLPAGKANGASETRAASVRFMERHDT